MGLIRTPIRAATLANFRVKPEELVLSKPWHSEGDISSWFFFLPHVEQCLIAANMDPLRDAPITWLSYLLDDGDPKESPIGLETKRRVLELIAFDVRLGLFMFMWPEAWLAIAAQKKHGGSRTGAGRKPKGK